MDHAESIPGRIGFISFVVKCTEKRSAGNPLAPFDEAGAGNAARSRSCDTRGRRSEPTGNTNFDLHWRASPRPYQMDQAAPADQSLLWHQRELCEDAKLGRGVGVRAGGHRAQAAGTGGQLVPDSTDSQPQAIRENANFTGTSRIRLLY